MSEIIPTIPYISRITLPEFGTHQQKIKYLLEYVYRANFQGTILDGFIVDNTLIRLKSYIEDGSAILFGAFIGNELVGFIWGYEREMLDQKRIHINQFVVETKQQRLGIGKLLMSAIEEEAVYRDIYTIELFVSKSNPGAVLFYTNSNFVVSRYQMEKQLTHPEDME